MSLWQAAVLGLLQGITQVLPVSWECHRLLLQSLGAWPLATEPAVETAAAAGAILAVGLALAGDLARAGRGWARSLRDRIPPDPEGARLGWNILIASLPTVSALLLLGDRLPTLQAAPLAVAGLSALFALLLGWSQRQGAGRLPVRHLGARGALVLGLAQLLALLPGSSRLGVVVTAALLLGLGRRNAARFGLLLTVPTGLMMILLSGARRGAELFGGGEVAAPAIAGLAAVATAFLGTRWLLRWLGRRGFGVFVGYRLAVAAAIAAAALA